MFAGALDVGLHVHDDVPLHVDLQHRHHCHDAADSGRRGRGSKGTIAFPSFFLHHIVPFHLLTRPASNVFNTQAINDEHAEKQQMAPLAEGEEEGEGVSNFLC